MREKINRTYSICAEEGCKARAMQGGKGFCFWHRANKEEERKELFERAANKRKLGLTPEKKCVVEKCKKWRKKGEEYCNIHTRLFKKAEDGSNVCKKEDCQSPVLEGDSGYCFWHSPQHAINRNRRLIKLERRRKEGPIEARCRKEGCRAWPMHDGSGYCYSHNEAEANKRRVVAKLRIQRVRWVKVPPERKCKFWGCKGWAMEKGEGLCFSHQPNFRMKQKYARLGQHIPWLGLRDIREARGLLFYSLEKDEPLMALRALRKIVSLRQKGEVWSPGKLGIDFKRNNETTFAHEGHETTEQGEEKEKAGEDKTFDSIYYWAKKAENKVGQ